MTAPLDDTVIDVSPVIVKQPGVNQRQPWDVKQFDVRFQMLSKVGRAKALDARETEKLYKDMRGHIVEQDQAIVALAHGKDRAIRDRAHLVHQIASMREQAANHEHAGPPTAAVQAVSGGTMYGEQLVAGAKAEARRILEEANRQLDDAKRAAAAGPQLVLPPEPVPSGNDIADAKAEAAYIREVKAALDDFRMKLQEYRAELDRQAQAVEDKDRGIDERKLKLAERQDEVIAAIDEAVRDAAEVREQVAAIDLTDGSESEPVDSETADVA
jgi:hypothetical protein